MRLRAFTPTRPDAKVPSGDPATAWARRRSEYGLISPARRAGFRVIVVGTGLAGGAAAAVLGELGYDVQVITYHDAPRRAHSVAAQGGINAAREGTADGDSLLRFVKDTVKGGDFRAREAEAFRLGEESMRVIDQLNALGTPFAREYGGTLATRSFGGVQVSRTFYARGQTGQQLQIATSQALLRQVRRGTVKLRPRTEMLDLVVDEGRACGVVVRDLVTGKIEAIPAHAVILATGGYGSVFYHSTLALSSNATAAWRAHKRGAWLANPSFVQFHPTALPAGASWQAKTTLMSESLRNDGRIWVPCEGADDRPPNEIPEEERDYYLERQYPGYGNLCPRDVASRAATRQIAAGRGVGPLRNAVYLDFRDALAAQGRKQIEGKYGNLFEMYRHATGEDPYIEPMRIAPGAHFTMGGLWTDYDLMSNLPGLFVGGEAGFAYHGANRLGANSLLSAAVDGWFVLPLSVPSYLSGLGSTELASPAVLKDADEGVAQRIRSLRDVGGDVSPQEFHERLGAILYRGCGVERTAGSLRAAAGEVARLKHEFWTRVAVPGTDMGVNQTLERAGRTADFIDLAQLMLWDALNRDESCGAHYRSEHQVGGEARRNDRHWAHVSAWESRSGPSGTEFVEHREPLRFEAIPLQTRSYK